jgi:hypothetical protein
MIRRIYTMATAHKTLYDAVKAAQPIIERDNMLLDDGAGLWSIDNLLTEIYNSDAADTEADGYYITAPDGSIGYTADDGYNVQWIYKAVAADAERV